jgi:predicted DNA-binding ribbon-helix-helix protein
VFKCLLGCNRKFGLKNDFLRIGHLKAHTRSAPKDGDRVTKKELEQHWDILRENMKKENPALLELVTNIEDSQSREDIESHILNHCGPMVFDTNNPIGSESKIKTPAVEARNLCLIVSPIPFCATRLRKYIRPPTTRLRKYIRPPTTRLRKYISSFT